MHQMPEPSPVNPNSSAARSTSPPRFRTLFKLPPSGHGFPNDVFFQWMVKPLPEWTVRRRRPVPAKTAPAVNPRLNCFRQVN